jgi:hypothetical protein
MTIKTHISDVSTWMEVVPPDETDSEACSSWFQTANSASVEWKVFRDGDNVIAALFDPIRKLHQRHIDVPPFPLFDPKNRRRETQNFVSARVSDGWIVGFDRGEFGGNLSWYSPDGSESYKICDANVIQLFEWSGNLHFVEGCAHLGMSYGYLLRLHREDGRWTTVLENDLKDAPYSVVERKSGSLLITLSEHLVEIDPALSRHVILDLSDRNIGWSYLYPNSSVLNLDEQRLYIGMRQFVAEVQIDTGKTRYLLPSSLVF